MTLRMRSRGIATVEFAIAVPVLLLLMFAAAELGRAFIRYTVVANAAREAARYLAERAIPSGTGLVSISNAVSTQTQNLAVYGRINASGSPRLPGFATGQVAVANAGGGNVSVTIVYPYVPMFGTRLPTLGVGGNGPNARFNMQVVVTMRAL
jgi:Flp pilus assembly protein TadG